MERLALEEFRGNAYRALGLKADATQADIDRAARMLRLFAASGDTLPPTDNDASWLGPVDRSPNAVERAVAILADPQRRAVERVWWFAQPPATDAAGPAAFSADTLHDALLLRCCRLLVAGMNVHNLPQWQTILADVNRLSRSDEYLDWLLRVETAGDFEKRASPEELAAAQANMAARVGTALVAIGDDALDYEDFPGASQAVTALRESADGTYDDATHQLLNRMEDTLSRRCEDLTESVDTAWKTRSIELLKPACLRLLTEYDDTIRSLMGEIVRASAGEEDRHQRVWTRVTKMLENTADAYEACHDKWNAKRTLDKALAVAIGTPAEARIRARIGQLLSAKTLLAPLPAPPVRPARQSGGSVFAGSGRGLWILVFVLIGLVRGIFSSLSSDSNSASSYRFTPPPPPPQEALQHLEKILQDIEDKKANTPSPLQPEPSSPSTDPNPSPAPRSP
jgi:hypothetical protein